MSNAAEPDASKPPASRLPRFDPLAYLIVISLLIYAFLVALPLVRGVPLWAGLYLGSLVFAALSLALVRAGAAWRLGPLEEGLLASSFLMAWVLSAKLPGLTDIAKLYLAPASNILFLLGCLFVGKILSRIVRERAMVLPVCVVAALADVFTVFWGPTSQALENVPELVKKLSVAIPEVGSAAGPEGAKGLAHVATMGIGDFIFLALFLSLAVRFGFPLARTFWAVLIAVAVGIVFALTIRGLAGMPLLPYVCLGFVAVNMRQFHLSAQERRDLLIALGVVVLLFGIVALALRL